MAQRVMIAMAIAGNPDVLIADEPTTALDVTIQLQILKLLKNLQRENNTAVLFVTHDLGVVSQISDRIQVLYAGEIVETGNVKDVLTQPLHPYTKGLIKSLPKSNSSTDELYSIPGMVPALISDLRDANFHLAAIKFLTNAFNGSVNLSEINHREVRCLLKLENETNE